MIRKKLKYLNSSSASGCDGVNVRHISIGETDILIDLLSDPYPLILTRNNVPDIFKLGVIVPILKKPSLNPNKAETENYRPITLSSTHSKLIELHKMPDDEANCNQFGFREKRGTSLACSLINDVSICFDNQGSPAYFCTPDAQKCFHNIWHQGLVYKLIRILKMPYRTFLFNC